MPLFTSIQREISVRWPRSSEHLQFNRVTLPSTEKPQQWSFPLGDWTNQCRSVVKENEAMHREVNQQLAPMLTATGHLDSGGQRFWCRYQLLGPSSSPPKFNCPNKEPDGSNGLCRLLKRRGSMQKSSGPSPRRHQPELWK